MKIIYSLFDKKTGKSIVKLADKRGVYQGEAKLHPNDKNYISYYTGCDIAEDRAWINFFKKEKRRIQAMLDATKRLKKDILLNCENIDKQILKRINLQLRDLTKEKEENIKFEKKLNDTIKERIKKRD